MVAGIPWRCSSCGVLLLLAGLLGAHNVGAQEQGGQEAPATHTVADRQTATVGEEITLSLTLPPEKSQAWGIRVEEPPKGIVVKRAWFIPGSEPGPIPTIKLVVSAFDLSLQEIPELEVQFTDQDGRAVSIRTEPQPLEMRRVTRDGEQRPEDILGPTGVGLSWWRYVLYLALLVILAALARFLWRRRPHREGKPAAPAPAEPLVPAHVKALAALDALERENLPSQGREREHCTRLSEIFRTYIEERYDFLALEQTTEEIRSSLGRVALPPLEAVELQGQALALLEEWDLVKFAKLPVAAEAARQMLESSRRWVEQTQPAFHVTDGDMGAEGAAQERVAR